jgi:anti-sigma factor RsiW
MECREVRQLAEVPVSEPLLIETTKRLVAHLEGCPACRAEIDGMRRLRGATQAAFDRAPQLAVRPEFAAALSARLRAEAGRRQPARTWRPWLAAAATFLVVAGTGWGWREWSATRFAALMHAAVGDHRFCAITYQLDERPISLEEAALRYDAVHRRLASVEPSPPTLSGGPVTILERHSCVFAGRRFAHIVLRYKGQSVSLLVAADERPGGAFARTFARADDRPSAWPVTDGFHVASFRVVRHAVFVVSSLSDADLEEVTRAMAGSVSRALAGG